MTRPAGQMPAALRELHQRLGGEQGIDAGGGRLPDHSLMQNRAQIAQRPEHLGAGHQHDQQRLDAHQTVDTRHTARTRAAAAPIAMPQSVMPRVITLVDSTRIVLSDSSRARSASRLP